MNWMIRFIITILLTSLTGTILFVAWYGIGQTLEKMGYVNIMYQLLRLLLVFWFVPLAYITIALDMNIGENGGNFLFFNTKIIEYISSIIVILWMLVVGYNSIKYLRSIYMTYLQCRENFECDVETREFFEDICNQLSVKRGRVQVRQSLHTPIPICVGAFRPMVIIPAVNYTKEQKRVIFVHELIHYKHKDQWLKHLSFIVGCVHCFNPISYLLKKKVQIWAEYACDDTAVGFIGSQKEYFEVIISMAESSAKLVGLYSSLVDDVSEIKNRMKHMQRSKNMIIKNKRSAILCVVTMFMISVCVVYVVTRLTERIYLNAYEATVEDVREESYMGAENDNVEYETTGADAIIIEEKDEIIVKDSSGLNYSFNWSVSNNFSKCSEVFSASDGDNIVIFAIGTPQDVNFRFGIVQPNGIRRYINGIGYTSHTFKLTQTGTYYVYVQNMSTTSDCEISGTYAIQQQ